VTDGPSTESKEVVGGFAILRCDSKAEVIELAKRFLEVAGDGETKIRQLYVAYDRVSHSEQAPHLRRMF
jgi:hypothetical protein